MPCKKICKMDLIYAILNHSIPNIVAKVQKIHKNFHFQRILNLSKQPVIYDTTNFPCKMTSEKPVQFSKRKESRAWSQVNWSDDSGVTTSTLISLVLLIENVLTSETRGGLRFLGSSFSRSLVFGLHFLGLPFLDAWNKGLELDAPQINFLGESPSSPGDAFNCTLNQYYEWLQSSQQAGKMLKKYSRRIEIFWCPSHFKLPIQKLQMASQALQEL